MITARSTAFIFHRICWPPPAVRPTISRAKSATPALRKTLDAMLARLEAIMPLARQLPSVMPDARLKSETAVIGALADRLIKLLRQRDPLRDDVKLGIFRAWGVLSPVWRAHG